MSKPPFGGLNCRQRSGLYNVSILKRQEFCSLQRRRKVSEQKTCVVDW